MEWLLSQQDAEGRWTNNYSYNCKMVVDIDRPGEPSRWVTLRACSVLKTVTEAGMGMKGIVASSAGLSLLLAEGIGDTIRVSITPEPDGDRTEEVAVAQQVLQSLGMRSFVPQVSSCPGCGRTTSTYFQELAQQIQVHLRDQMPVWRATHPGVEDLRVAVMGCVVNGPGESKHADIGISLPGTFEEPVAPVFIDGALDRTLRGDRIIDEFKEILDGYVERRFPAPGA